MPASSSSSLARASGPLACSCRSFSMSASSVSRWLDTLMYSPQAMLRAPATRPAMPDSCMARRLSLPAPTPSIKLATLTRPSFAPSTKARSQGALQACHMAAVCKGASDACHVAVTSTCCVQVMLRYRRCLLVGLECMGYPGTLHWTCQGAVGLRRITCASSEHDHNFHQH